MYDDPLDDLVMGSVLGVPAAISVLAVCGLHAWGWALAAWVVLVVLAFGTP